MNNKMKILLLGAQGNLGSEIYKELKSNPIFQVIPWSRKTGNLTQKKILEEKIVDMSPNIIINTVAYNNVDACEKELQEQQKAIELNINLVANLTEITKKINATLIHFSTNYVFSGEKTCYKTNDTAHPINFYGLTKKMGEDILLSETELGLKAHIIRVSNLFGPKGTSSSSKPSFFEAITKAALEKDFLSIVDDEICCFTYTKDVAEMIAHFLQNNNTEVIYHFVNSGPTSWYDAAKLYFNHIQNNVSITPIKGDCFNRPAKRPHSAILTVEENSSYQFRDFESALFDYIKEYQC